MKYDNYIGLPYKNNGRDTSGIDCWGLVCLFYKNELNIDLPSYTEEYDGAQDLRNESLLTKYKQDSWTKTTTPEVGNVVLFNILGELCHVGIYLGNNKFMHSREGKDSVIESLSNVKWAKRVEGIYERDQTSKIEVIGSPHPLKTMIHREWTVAGTTVEDFAKFIREKYTISQRIASRLVILIDGEIIPKDKWATTVLQADQKIAYRSVAEGKEGLRMLLVIAIVVIAIETGYVADWGASLASTTGLSVTTSTALVQGAVTFAAAMLVNAILPIRPLSQNDPGSPIAMNLFTGASNQVNRFGAIPVVLGRVRTTGLMGATPYVETLTDTTILNLLIVWGFGPLDVSDICIGANTMSSYYDGFVQDIPRPVTLAGYPVEDSTTFDKQYSQDVEQHMKNVELANNEAGNPYVEQTFLQECTGVDVALSFPEGMRGILSNGDITDVVAGIEIQLGTWNSSTNSFDFGSTPPYTLGNPSSSNPNPAAYVNVIAPSYYGTMQYDGDGGYYNSNTPLYRYTTYAMVPGGSIARVDGAATDILNADPSINLINMYKAGSYANLVTSDTTYKHIPQLPSSYLPLYTVCTYGGTGIISTVSHLNNYLSYTGLELTSLAVQGTLIDGDGGSYTANSGATEISISAGNISQTEAAVPDSGVEVEIFKSRNYAGMFTSGPNGNWCSFLNDNGMWYGGTDSLDISQAITFPYSGYYNIEGAADDSGFVKINGTTVLTMPGFSYVSSALYYVDAGTYQVQLLATNTGGPKAAACRISYTANSGLNTVASTNTELEFGSVGFFNKRKDPFNFVYRMRNLDRGRYAVRVRRTTSDVSEIKEGDKTLHKYFRAIFFTATAFDNTTPMVNPPGCYLAKTAIRVQSTNKANGNIDGLNAMVCTIALDWNRSTQKWAPKQTNNPASLFMYVLTHPANAFKIDSQNIGSSIDLPALQEWHEFCDPIDPSALKLTYNNVITNASSILDILRDICAAGMASPAYIDGKWSVVVDKPRSHTTQYFTTHNSWGFESTKTLPRIPDAFRITIPDESKAYQANEIYVYNYGKDATNAKLFESISLPGVTNVAQATHLARWHLAQLKLRPELYTLSTDFEYLVCTRGDVVKVTHDVPLWGLGSGRIKQIVDGNTLVLTEDLLFEAGKTYTILIRTNNVNAPDGVIKTIAPITTTGWTNTVDIVGTISSGDQIEVDNLFMVGEINKETQQLVVVGIEPTSSTGARLTLVDYSPEIYTADLGGLLVFNSNTSTNSNYAVLNTIKFAPIINQVTSSSALSEEISSGTYQNILIISFSNPSGLTKNAEKIETQLIASDAEFQGSSPGNNYIVSKETASLTIPGLQTGRIYKLRSRYISANGSNVGPWCSIYYSVNSGKNINSYVAPTISLDLQGTYIIASPTTDLNKPANFKTYEYRLYKDSGLEDFWDLDPVANNILVTQSTVEGRFNLTQMPLPRISDAGITYRVACRGLDNTNNYSADSALGTIVVATIK